MFTKAETLMVIEGWAAEHGHEVNVSVPTENSDSTIIRVNMMLRHGNAVNHGQLYDYAGLYADPCWHLDQALKDLQADNLPTQPNGNTRRKKMRTKAKYTKQAAADLILGCLKHLAETEVEILLFSKMSMDESDTTLGELLEIATKKNKKRAPKEEKKEEQTTETPTEETPW